MKLRRTCCVLSLDSSTSGTAEAAAAPAVADRLSPLRELGAAPEGPASHLTSAPLLRILSAKQAPAAGARVRWRASWRDLWLATKLLEALEARERDEDACAHPGVGAAAIRVDARPQGEHTAAMAARRAVPTDALRPCTLP